MSNQGRAKDFDTKRKKYYHLVMFPYPSGDLHMGHWFNFAGADILARKKFMDGYNVLSPIGFDAFGLPAENAAIARGIDPATWTQKNISNMRKQLHSMEAMYDWSREISTADPQYYKWTQWLFIQLYNKGLAYKAKVKANWCPGCQTVLANEQVVAGECERCGSKVVQKEIEQWLFKITAYADRLLEDLDRIDWPEKTKHAQRNWIGKSTGRLVEFKIQNSKFKIDVFTTRPDTIKGATYMVLAPEHELVVKITAKSQDKAVKEYAKKAQHKSERERQMYDKSGVFTGAYAVNPVTKEKIPVWVADYVISGYGTGAIMAVPAHDERDKEFAKTNNLPIGSGELIDPKGIGRPQVQYKLRDWIISRQRYWGVPIPIVYCKTCGIQTVRESDLPVKLPKIKDYLPKGKPPLATATAWVNTFCPKCGGKAARETETLDTFVDSSWYFLRYADPHNSKKFADEEKLKYWLPVDMYIGGAEHTVLHLLYARFITKALYDFKLIEFDEPFAKLRHQGIILGSDHHKMSKSRGNVADPYALVAKHGAGAVRMFLAFMGPYDQGGPWSDEGFQGVVRYLNRVRKTKTTASSSPAVKKLVAKTVKKVGADIDELRFNTAVAALMMLQNEIDKHGIGRQEYKTYVQLLAPFVPSLAEELSPSVFQTQWPQADKQLLKDETVVIAVQVNGKTKATITVAADASRREVEKQAASVFKNKAKKVIYVPGRVINFVV